jgi:inner membrane protein
MTLQLAYWHWLILGMVLILAETMIPSFTVFWFGLAALLIGGLAFLGIEPSLPWQVFYWALLSACGLLAWFKWIRPKAKDKTKAGLSREAVIGERGMIIKAPMDGIKGEVRFVVPLLGNDTWPCHCHAPLKIGDTVTVKDVLGNALLVEPMTSTTSPSS